MAEIDGYGGRLESNPAGPTCSPVIEGTHLSVGAVVGYVLDGYAWQAIRSHYPEITKDDIRACLEYAADECRRVREMVV